MEHPFPAVNWKINVILFDDVSYKFSFQNILFLFIYCLKWSRLLNNASDLLMLNSAFMDGKVYEKVSHQWKDKLGDNSLFSHNWDHTWNLLYYWSVKTPEVNEIYHMSYLLKSWSIIQATCGPVLQNVWFLDDSHRNHEAKELFNFKNISIYSWTKVSAFRLSIFFS